MNFSNKKKKLTRDDKRFWMKNNIWFEKNLKKSGKKNKEKNRKSKDKNFFKIGAMRIKQLHELW